MNIHTRLSLTIIAVVSVGATNAIAKTPNPLKKPLQYLQNRAPGPMKQAAEIGGNAFCGLGCGQAARGGAAYIQGPPGIPYNSRQNQQANYPDPVQQQDEQQYEQQQYQQQQYQQQQYMVYQQPIGTRCMTPTGWQYAQPAPVGTPCATRAYGVGGRPM
jgi:hypothetical protein